MYIINFLWNKIAPKSVVFRSWKKFEVLEKKVFSKKILPAYKTAYKTYKTVWEIFSKLIGLKIFNFRWFFWFRKTFLYHKIINKTQSTKNQENSAHRFGDNYLTNHLVKFLQERIKHWRVGALRVCTGYHFFNENR